MNSTFISIRWKCLIVVWIFLFFVGNLVLTADWIDEGTAVCTAGSHQENPRIVSDGAGGAIITWDDERNGSGDIYAQRIDANGNRQWLANGVAICTQASSQYVPQIVSDGSGGAIIIWEDHRGSYSDIYAQKIDANGNVQWTSDGVAVATGIGNQHKPQLIPILGGAIITWQDWRSTYSNIHAQRIDSAGNTLWATNGVIICSESSLEPQIAANGGTGAIIAYRKWNQLQSAYDIYAQQIDLNGNTNWTVNGVPVLEGEGDDMNHQLVADGNGGAIVVCENHGGSWIEIQAQRINSNGSRLWSFYPFDDDICLKCRWDQKRPQLTRDNNGNVIIAYEDYRGDIGIFAQKLLLQNGASAWADSGVPISAYINGNRIHPQITLARNNGAIITWHDNRNGTYNYDIYAQMVDENGNTLWIENGFPICTELYYQTYPQLTSDGSDGAFITWEDKRTGSSDIYAYRLIPEMACAITWEPVDAATGTPTNKDTVVGCPAGDLNALKITIDFNNTVMVRDIQTTEITLEKIGDNITFWNDGNIYADSPAVSPDYVTTITHSYIGGCSVCPGCIPPDIPVRLNGIRIGWIESLKVCSPDMNNDGAVDLIDFTLFGNTYNKAPDHPDFTLCGDFSLDGLVDLLDFTVFGNHYQHTHPF